MIGKWGLFLCAALLIITGCSSSQCNNVPQRPLPEPSPSPQNQGDYRGAIPTATPSAPRLPSVDVYKGTGELQCGTGKAIPIEDMQFTLTQNKVTVYDSKTQLDGLMHVALCGSPTGKIHVFTIPQRDLKKAQKLGFKVWKSK